MVIYRGSGTVEKLKDGCDKPTNSAMIGRDERNGLHIVKKEESKRQDDSGKTQILNVEQVDEKNYGIDTNKSTGTYNIYFDETERSDSTDQYAEKGKDKYKGEFPASPEQSKAQNDEIDAEESPANLIYAIHLDGLDYSDARHKYEKTSKDSNPCRCELPEKCEEVISQTEESDTLMTSASRIYALDLDEPEGKDATNKHKKRRKGKGTSTPFLSIGEPKFDGSADTWIKRSKVDLKGKVDRNYEFKIEGLEQSKGQNRGKKSSTLSEHSHCFVTDEENNRYVERDNVNTTARNRNVSTKRREAGRNISDGMKSRQVDEADVEYELFAPRRSKLIRYLQNILDDLGSRKFNSIFYIFLMILSSSSVSSDVNSPGQYVELRQGDNASISFYLEFPPDKSFLPSYIIHFELIMRPFARDGILFSEGLKHTDQLERFEVISSRSDHSLSVNLNIQSVTAHDDGVYVLKLTLYGSNGERPPQETVKRVVEVHVPPGKLKCYTTESEYPHLKEIHCHATSGNRVASLSCFQDNQKVPYKGEISQDRINIRGVFWMNLQNSISCCSHDIEQEVSEESCNDFHWAPEIRETSSKHHSTARPTEKQPNTPLYPGEKHDSGEYAPFTEVNSGSYGQNHVQELALLAIPLLITYGYAFDLPIL